VPADEQAANGPLVGDPSLIPGEQSCVAAEGNAPWYPAIAAFEVHDSNRTHLYDCAHFTGSMSGPSQVFAYSSPQDYPTPYNVVDEGPDELFIYGGGYGDNPAASGSFVARVEPGTLNQVWRRVLINTNATGEWDYPGVLNVLADGSLVVIYGYHIAKLDPATGDVLAQTTLPRPRGSAMAVMGNYVVAMTNGQPTSTPMSVIAVSQADAKQIANLQPFASSGAKNSLIPSMVSVDPQNNRIYVMDAGAGKMAGVNLQNGKLSVAWTRDQTTLSFTTLIGPKDQRVLIGTNIPVKTFQGLKSYTTEQVIWRNAQTGQELASSSLFPKMTQGILVTPGYAGLQYFLTADGHIIALQVTPKQ
jgi:PQQ-like domain